MVYDRDVREEGMNMDSKGGMYKICCIVPLKWIECGVYGDLYITYPKPCSIYLRGTIDLRGCRWQEIVQHYTRDCPNSVPFRWPLDYP